MKKDETLFDMGLILHKLHGRLIFTYGMHHGFGCGWLPAWIQRLIVHTWNRTYCALWGHDDCLRDLAESGELDELGCVDCSTPLPFTRLQRVCSICGEPFGTKTTTLTVCETCYDEGKLTPPPQETP